jgi:predicted deacetylase
MTASIAVALHDVEPATYERCALIRDWLDDHGIDRVTLLVIPASDLHPFHDRSPELAEWLAERVQAGDRVAQHGFQHRQVRHAASPARQAYAHIQGRDAAEFVGLDDDETRRAVAAGRRVLRLAGIDARGFVAPAYAYTAALQRTLGTTFDWWAGLSRLWSDHGRRSAFAPALTLGTSSALKRMTSPALMRAGALVSGPLLRLDLHPADLDHPRHMGAVESVLRHAGRRTAVTYDDLASD